MNELEKITDNFSTTALDPIIPDMQEILTNKLTSELPRAFTGDRFNDDANANYLLHLYGDRMRFTRSWGWCVWDGNRWKKNADHLAMQLAKAAGRNLYNDASIQADDKDAKKLAKHANKTLDSHQLEAMLKLAKSEVTKETDEFDRDKYLINCQNGILDLKTGTLRPHEPDAMLTKMAGTIYDPYANCPKFKNFLDRIMSGNTGMIDFLQRAVGYSLTGDVSEQAFFFLHGQGANGKSTFIKTILEMLGDYGGQTSPNFLTDPGRFETACLAGLRFCATVEVTEGKSLAEAVVKQMTGGDRMVGEFKNKDQFSFEPTFKIWLAANHKPTIRGTDYAIWRRVKLIPFSVTIPDIEQNHNLLIELTAELPGIFNWAVQGCLAWLDEGLKIPDEVKRATAEYKEDSDIVGQFINASCLLSPEMEVKAKDLYNAFKTWAEQSGERVISQTSFGRKLDERELHRKHLSEGNKYFGIGLKAL